MKNLFILVIGFHSFNSVLAQTWISLGPVANSVGSDYIEYNAGQVHSISYDPSDVTNKTFYASCPYGGLWKTINEGSTWTLITKDNQLVNANGGVSDAAVHPTNPQKIFISTGHDVKSKWGTSGGVYITTDGGTNWSQTGLVFSLCDKVLINRLIINPNNGDVLLASTTSGLYRTTDGGATWSSVLTCYETTSPYNPITVQCTSVEFKPDNPNVVYASVVNSNGFKIQPIATDFDRTAEILKSTDGGATWSVNSNTGNGGTLDFEIGTFAGSATNLHLAVGGPSSHPDYLYAVIQSTIGYLLYQYNGTSWNARNIPIGSPDGGSISRLTIAANPQNADEVLLANVGIYKSTDQGQSWSSNIQSGILHDDCWVLSYHPATGDLYYGGDGGFCKRLTNSWEDKNTDFNNCLVWGFGNADYSKGKIIAGYQDLGSNYYEYASTPVWKHKSTGDGTEAFFDYSDQSKTYYSMQGNNFYRCTTAFTGCSSLIYNIEFNYDHPQGIQDPINEDWFYFGNNELQRYDENTGLSTVSAFGTGSFKVVSMAINNYDNNRIYLCHDNPYLGGGFKFYHTLNGTATTPTWDDDITSVIPVNNGSYTITSMAIKDVKPSDNIDTIWIAVHYDHTLTLNSSSKKVYMLIGNSGSYTATEFNSGIDQCDDVNSIVYREGSNDELYIGTETGVYYRNASMTAWVPLGTGLPKARVTEVEIVYCVDSLRCSTFGRGIWSVALPTLNTPDAKVICITSNTTWDKNRTIPTNVVVQANATLTINNSAIINMAKHRYLKVMPGAKLIINNATITNSCGFMWSGIQVVGDPNKTQTAANQGVLEMKNGAKIENAYVAVMADEAVYTAPDYAFPNGSTTEGGGIIKLDESFIDQCRNGVGFAPYPASGIAHPNKSYIRLCTLSCIGLLNTANPNYTNEFISLNDVHGVQIQGNTINGFTGAPLAQRGIAISSWNSNYLVNIYCTPNQNPPCNTFTENNFNNLYRGVYGLVSDPSQLMGVLTIDQNIFTGCSRNIYLSGYTNAPEVTRNEINLTLSTSDTTYAIYASACNGYSIEENLITGQSQSLSYGILINNSGPYDNLVYKNRLEALRYGCISKNQNANEYDDIPNIGLQFRCNNFYDIRYNIAVFTCAACTGYDETIRKDQGICDATITGPASNTFNNLPGGGYSLWKQANPKIHYHHHSNSPYAPPSGTWLRFITDDCLIDGEENSCPTNFCEGCFAQSSSMMMNSISSSTESAESLMKKIDGGSTQQLLDLMTDAALSASSVLESLLTESPYLSDTVLIAAIKRTPSLTDADLEQLMKANAPVSENVYELLSVTKSVVANDADLLQVQDGSFSAMQKLENEISNAYLNQSTGIHKLVRYFLKNEKADSALQYLLSIGANYRALPLALAFSDFKTAQQIIDDMPVASQSEIYLRDYYQLLLDQQQSGKSLQELNEDQIEQVRKWANETSEAGYYALNLLNLIKGEVYYEDFPVIEEATEQSEKTTQQSTDNLTSSSVSLRVIPNPAANKVTVSVTNYAGDAEFSIEVFDFTGNLKFDTDLQSGTAKDVDISDLPPGVYMFRAVAKSGSSASQKVMVVRE